MRTRRLHRYIAPNTACAWVGSTEAQLARQAISTPEMPVTCQFDNRPTDCRVPYNRLKQGLCAGAAVSNPLNRALSVS